MFMYICTYDGLCALWNKATIKWLSTLYVTYRLTDHLSRPFVFHILFHEPVVFFLSIQPHLVVKRFPGVLINERAKTFYALILTSRPGISRGAFKFQRFSSWRLKSVIKYLIDVCPDRTELYPGETKRKRESGNGCTFWWFFWLSLYVLPVSTLLIEPRTRGHFCLYVRQPHMRHILSAEISNPRMFT